MIHSRERCNFAASRYLSSDVSRPKRDRITKEAPMLEQLRLRLNRKMLRTIRRYSLLQEGDRVMVAVSGGKDSYTLLELLASARARLPFNFEIIAVHLDQGQPGYDGRPLEGWLEESGIPFEILRQDTYSVVMRVTGGEGTFCAPCARLRRGALYSAAERLSCNKIALGHHRDDTIETLLMNLFYSGRIQAMPAGYQTNDGRFEVIRPLIECGEADIASYAALRDFPILPCNLCGSQSGLKRERMKQLLSTLESEIPDLRDVMLASLRNVNPTHLLDRELLDRVQTGEPLESERPEEGALIQIEG
ncbi:MAG: tRNA 2-thiocytidine(32) synthetase TtcA [Myxococcota bacterium]|nr:tRNA 2-thiocytidine(32) synthetase TtcA [Myxococcota bacterium]